MKRRGCGASGSHSSSGRLRRCSLSSELLLTLSTRETERRSQRILRKKLNTKNRTSRARDDITRMLPRAVDLRVRYQFDAAEELLIGAKSRLSDIPDPRKLTAKVDQSLADLLIVRRLDEIRLKKASWTNEGFNFKFAEGRNGAYSQAFRQYGIHIFGDDSAGDVGRQIAAANVSESLIAALDNWWLDDKEHQDAHLGNRQCRGPRPVFAVDCMTWRQIVIGNSAP